MINSGLYEKMKEITIRVTTADDRSAVPTMNEILRRLLNLVCSKTQNVVRKQAVVRLQNDSYRREVSNSYEGV